MSTGVLCSTPSASPMFCLEESPPLCSALGLRDACGDWPMPLCPAPALTMGRCNEGVAASAIPPPPPFHASGPPDAWVSGVGSLRISPSGGRIAGRIPGHSRNPLLPNSCRGPMWGGGVRGSGRAPRWRSPGGGGGGGPCGEPKAAARLGGGGT